MRKEHPQLECEEAIAAAVRYLLQEQQTDGSWRSYRWRGSVSTTGMVIQALQAAAPYTNRDQPLLEAQWRERAFLLRLQLPEGAWRADDAGQACPFQSALALAALVGWADEKCRTSLEAAGEYLHRSQYLNGCWHASTELLRFPVAAEQLMRVQQGVRSEQNSGTPVLDHLHVFTTATVLHALTLLEMSRRQGAENRG